MKAKTESIEYEKHTQEILAKTRKGLPRVRSNIDQSDCPHWALDLIEELGADSTEVTRKNLYQSLSIALINNELMNKKYPQLMEIVQIAVIKEITFKPTSMKAGKQKTDARRKILLMVKLLNAITRDLLASVKKGDRFTYVPQYIADAKKQKGKSAIKPESFYKALASAWDLDQGSHADADSYMSIKQFIRENENAHLIYKSFIPIKVPI